MNVKIKKTASGKFRTVGQLVVFRLKQNPEYPMDKLTAEIKKIKPKCAWCGSKVSAKQQYTWYKSAIKSGRLNKVLKNMAR